jgi:hypothetical protein
MDLGWRPVAELPYCSYGGDSHFTIVSHAESGLEWLRHQI